MPAKAATLTTMKNTVKTASMMGTIFNLFMVIQGGRVAELLPGKPIIAQGAKL